jgi:hypothetical protein
MAQIRQVSFEPFLRNIARNEDALSTSALPFGTKIKHFPPISTTLDQNPATEHFEPQGRHVTSLETFAAALRPFMPPNVPIQRPDADKWMLALYPSRLAATGC